MKLPEHFKNWIELAKDCADVKKRHPDAIIVNYDRNGICSSYNINEAKAKAFDELSNMSTFYRDSVIDIDRIIKQSHYQFSESSKKELSSMMDTLILLSKA